MPNLPFLNNPVALKELRQSVRNRLMAGSLIGFLLLLVAALALTFQTALNASSGSPSRDDLILGPVVFGISGGLLSLLVLLVSPFAVFQRLVSERGKNRADLLFATPLPVSRIVDGKLYAGLAMALLYLSAALPFLILSYQLRGIELGDILSFVCLLVPAAVASTMLGLLAGALPMPAVLVRVLYGMGLFGLIPMVIAAVVAFASGEADIPGTGVAQIVLAFITAIFFLRAATILSLAPATTNYTPSFRVTGPVLCLVWIVTAAVCAAIEKEEWPFRPALAFLMVICGTHFFQSIVMRPGVNRRTLLEIRPGRRFPQFLLFSTAEGGICHALLLLFVSLLLCQAAAGIVGVSLYLRDIQRLLSVFLYLAAWMLVVRRVSREFPSFPHPLALALVSTLVPFGWSVATSIASSSRAESTIPGNLFAALSTPYSSPLAFHFVCSIVLFLIAFLLSLPVIVRAWRDFRNPEGQINGSL